MSRLEKATNVAIIVACLFLVGTLVRNYYFSGSPDVAPAFTKGSEVKLPLAASGQPTLVLALSKSCHFCSESTPFYQKLAEFKNSSSPKLRLVAVLPDNQEEAEGYLKGKGIGGVDAVISMPLNNLGVRATPTLLLLDGQNKVEEFWVGKLNEDGEKTVIERLKKVCTGCSI